MNDIQRLERIYGIAGRELRSMLMALDPLAYDDAKGRLVMAKSRELARTLNVAVVQWADYAVPRAYAKGERIARTALEILGKKPKRMQLYDRTVKIKDDAAMYLIRANNSIPATVGEYMALMALAAQKSQSMPIQEFEFAQAADRIREWAQTALRLEQSAKTLAAKLRDFFTSFVSDDRYIEVKGKRWSMRKYSRLVARATLGQAQTGATLDLCNIYDNDLVQFSSHGTTCEICAPYEGRVFSLSGRHPVYPKLDAIPPHELHPNCEHSILPTSELAIEARGRFG